MLGRADNERQRSRVAFATAITLAVGLVALVAIAFLQRHEHTFSARALPATLLVLAFCSGLAVVSRTDKTSVSGGFLVILLAAALTGPTVACACAALAEVAAAWRSPSRPYA